MDPELTNRAFCLMGHIQTKDQLQMDDKTVRHLAMLFVYNATTDNLE